MLGLGVLCTVQVLLDTVYTELATTRGSRPCSMGLGRLSISGAASAHTVPSHESKSKVRDQASCLECYNVRGNVELSWSQCPRSGV